MGVSPPQTSWDCFLGSYSGTPSTVTATVSCLKVGDWQPGAYQFCGNYKVESPEVCDKANVNGLTCEDFFSSDGVQLCNGSLACTIGCDAYNLSSCVYCNKGPCASGILCSDLTCQDDCTGHGGPSGPGGGGSIGGGSGSSCPAPGICPGIPPSPPGGGLPPFCGDFVVNPLTEECDPPSGAAGSLDCGGGYCVNGVYYVATCSSSCQCIPPSFVCPPGGGNAYCQDGIVNQSDEQCDMDPLACDALGPAAPGTHYECTAACQCISIVDDGAILACDNDGIVDDGEECDGDASVCSSLKGPITGPGAFYSCIDCKCVGQACGNGVREGTEECDLDASVCSSGPVTGGSYFCSNECACVWDPFFE
jgi:hypothetical protein